MASKVEHYPWAHPHLGQWNKPCYRRKKYRPVNYPFLESGGSENCLYNHAKSFMLTKEELEKYGYPYQSPEHPGKTLCNLSMWEKEQGDKCSRCWSPYLPNAEKDADSIPENNCQYHKCKPIPVNGAAMRFHPCCWKQEGMPGCQLHSHHVSSSYNVDNKLFVSTTKKDSRKKKNYIYSLDCEMCYTLNGLEVARVSVITYYGFLIYETYVLPEAPIIDYNTEHSGITADDLKGVTIKLSDVQEKLLELFDSDTILVGHALENDFKALGLIHENVIDTSALFPHKCGWPYRRSLKSLVEAHLNYSIQKDNSGHDSIEDARACLDLLFLKILGFC